MILKKILAITFILLLILSILFLLNNGKKFPATKKVLIITRQLVSGNNDEFVISDTDKVVVINGKEEIDLFNKIHRLRGNYIAKSRFPGKAVTINNDTIDIIITIPGPFIIYRNEKKRYGFRNSQRQSKLSTILGLK